MSAKVVSVNLNAERGFMKYPVEEVMLKVAHGVIGDGHAGEWHKQVSLVGLESYKKMETQENTTFKMGAFAENITTEDIVLYELTVGMKLRIGEALIEVSQIGKKIHPTNFKTMLPKEGIFAIVLEGGVVKNGDTIVFE